MRPGSHMTEESKAKMSVSGIGRIQTLEHRAKISATQKEHFKSPEARAKRVAELTGRTVSPETRAKLHAAFWKGGHEITMRRYHARRKLLGFIPLNSWFAGCQGHHIDPEQVIFMPKKLHRSIPHRLSDGRGMAQINAIAHNFLFKQEVEAVMAVGGSNG